MWQFSMLAFQIAKALFKAVCFAIYYSGLYHVVSFLKRYRPVIIMYHSVNVEGCSYIYPDNILNVRDFERQISYLVSKRKVVSLHELVKYVREGAKPPAYAVAITFDDGYYDFYSKVYPILKKFHVPCTLFLITSQLDTGEMKWEDRLAYLINMSKTERLAVRIDNKLHIYNLTSPRGKLNCIRDLNSKLTRLSENERQKTLLEIENKVGRLKPSEKVSLTLNEVEKLSKEKLVTFGCHTHNHKSLTAITLEEAEKEIATSKDKLEEYLKKPCNIFAYPIGKKRDFNQSIKDLLKAKGFEAACTTIPGTVSKHADVYELRRVAAPKDSSYMFKCSLIGITLQGK